jgi:hypothetical protein
MQRAYQCSVGAQEVSKQRMSKQEPPKPRGWVTPEGSR